LGNLSEDVGELIAFEIIPALITADMKRGSHHQQHLSEPTSQVTIGPAPMFTFRVEPKPSSVVVEE
jgi:hypothetical protein